METVEIHSHALTKIDVFSDAKFKLVQCSNLQKMEDLCIIHVQMCSIQLVESSAILDLNFREDPVLECAYLMVNGVGLNQGTVTQILRYMKLKLHKFSLYADCLFLDVLQKIVECSDLPGMEK